MENFFTKLEELCRNKGISMAQMQRDCGIGNGTAYRWKKGNIKPNIVTIDKVAKYFNVSMRELMPPYPNSEEVCAAPVTGNHKLPNNMNSAVVKGERTADFIEIIKLQHETLCEQLRMQNEQLRMQNEQLRIQNKKNDDLVEIINNLTKLPHESKARGRVVDLAGVRGV
jgi:transcriptional regulator with XRE-family HTH domain